MGEKKSILDTEFQYYPSRVNAVKPLGKVTLKQFIDSVKNPKPHIEKVFKDIQSATEKNDLKLKDKLKQENLYYFTPSVIFDGKNRSYENVIEYNELMIVEFDKIDFSKELKEYLFYKMDSIICAFTSPSAKGMKAIVKIPKPKDEIEYKEYFCGLAYYLDQIEGFDIANYNPLLPLFLSMDRDILWRDNPKTWRIKGEKINSFKPISLEDIEPVENVTEEDKNYVVNIIKKKINEINDNGHGNLRSASLLLGGYVASSYISLSEAESLLEDLVRGNSYFSKNLRNYIKTSKHFLSEGSRAPLTLKRQNYEKR